MCEIKWKKDVQMAYQLKAEEKKTRRQQIKLFIQMLITGVVVNVGEDIIPKISIVKHSSSCNSHSRQQNFSYGQNMHHNVLKEQGRLSQPLETRQSSQRYI